MIRRIDCIDPAQFSKDAQVTLETLIVLACGSPASLQPELPTVALWSHLNPYFPCSQRVLQDAWKPLVIPVQGLSQLFIACSRQ